MGYDFYQEITPEKLEKIGFKKMHKDIFFFAITIESDYNNGKIVIRKSYSGKIFGYFAIEGTGCIVHLKINDMNDIISSINMITIND